MRGRLKVRGDDDLMDDSLARDLLPPTANRGCNWWSNFLFLKK